MASPIIELESVSKKYDDQYAVKNLSLTIKKGEIFGLLGPNGAGKTTTILMILGLSEPSSGSIHVSGIHSIQNPLEVKRRVGYLPDNLGFYQNMTGRENLIYTAELNKIPRKVAEERAAYLLEKVNLTEAADKKTGKYSRGMKQRLGLADVLMKNPEVIILDEPTLGIDPEGVRELLKLIRSLSVDENVTVLLSSHHLHQIQQICDRVGIFVKGELLVSGNIQSLAKQLFQEDTFIVHVKASPIEPDLLEKLRKLKQIKRIEEVDDGLDIYCNENITEQISKTIIDSGAALYHLSNKNLGLDEIYHRYFEGRDVHEYR